jgi:hypothetical protein
MTSGKKISRLMMPWLLMLASSSWCDEPDVAELIARLAKPAPTTVAFTEVRFSKMLREPLVVSGELVYGGPRSLDRRVTEPYREDTLIRGETVRVERKRQASRSFGLQRAPELRGLLSGLSALLAGDLQAIQRDFVVTAQGDQRAWELELIPSDARIRKRLKMIRARGSDAEPRCFELINAGDGLSIMLLGAAARPALTQSPAKQLTREALQRYCAGDS